MIGRILACCLVLAAGAGVRTLERPGAQPPRLADLAPGSRLYIAAARDSRLFTLCPSSYTSPVDGVVLRQGEGFTAVRMSPPRTSSYWSDYMNVIVREPGDKTGFQDQRAFLLVPPADRPTANEMIERVELDRPAWDEATAAAVASEVTQHQRFLVADSAEAADYVLLVEAQYATVASFSGRTAQGGGMISQMGGDREANFPMALFAVVVPARDYLAHGPDVGALLPVSLWQGMALSTMRGVGPGATTRPGMTPASVASIVTQLHDRQGWPRAVPPPCAASANPATHSTLDTPRRSNLGVQDLAPERSSPSATSGGATPAFSTGVTYVSVPVDVRDGAGRPITDLTTADFRIYEDGAEQTVDRLMTMSAGVDVALVVDTSSSVRGQLADMHNALLGFIERLRPDDRLLLASFDERVFVQAELTSERDRQRRAVSQMWMARGQGTRLYDALDLVVKRHPVTVGDRAAIVVFTDGVDTRSRLADADSTRLLMAESGAPVYVIQYDTRSDDYSLPSGLRSNGMSIRDMTPTLMPEGGESNTALFMRAHSYLAAITDLSGGRIYQARTAGSLNQAFSEIARELREHYTLWYRPANQQRDGTYRTLHVEVARPGVTVRARDGYRTAPLRQR